MQKTQPLHNFWEVTTPHGIDVNLAQDMAADEFPFKDEAFEKFLTEEVKKQTGPVQFHFKPWGRKYMYNLKGKERKMDLKDKKRRRKR
jgi:hypothetical protein